MPLISELVALLLEGLFARICKVSDLNCPSLVCILYDLGEPRLAANNGVNDRIFHRHGRWKSEQAEDTYVEDNLEQRLEVLVLFGGNIT